MSIVNELSFFLFFFFKDIIKLDRNKFKFSVHSKKQLDNVHCARKEQRWGSRFKVTQDYPFSFAFNELVCTFGDFFNFFTIFRLPWNPLFDKNAFNFVSMTATSSRLNKRLKMHWFIAFFTLFFVCTYVPVCVCVCKYTCQFFMAVLWDNFVKGPQGPRTGWMDFIEIKSYSIKT